MATRSRRQRDELLVFGFIRFDDAVSNKEIPTDIMNLCTDFYHLVFEILSFSDKFCSDEAFTFSDDNRCVTAVCDGHKWVLADIEPVTEGTHCWRIQVLFIDCYTIYQLCLIT